MRSLHRLYASSSIFFPLLFPSGNQHNDDRLLSCLFSTRILPSIRIKHCKIRLTYNGVRSLRRFWNISCHINEIPLHGNDISHAWGDKSIFKDQCHPLFFILQKGHHIGYDMRLYYLIYLISQAN